MDRLTHYGETIARTLQAAREAAERGDLAGAFVRLVNAVESTILYRAPVWADTELALAAQRARSSATSATIDMAPLLSLRVELLRALEGERNALFADDAQPLSPESARVSEGLAEAMAHQIDAVLTKGSAIASLSERLAGYRTRLAAARAEIAALRQKPDRTP